MANGTIYDSLFFDSFDEVAQASAEAVVPLVLAAVDAASVIDVGCGRGYWLREFQRLGVEQVFGVDGGEIKSDRLVIAPHEFVSLDLSTVVDGGSLNPTPRARFDLAVCMEVAEHLPLAAADSFIYALVRLAPVVLFSAAIPGQGGTGHLNEQWPSYWAAIFAKNGYVPIDQLRRRIWRNETVGVWYRQNLLLYIDKARLDAYRGGPGDVVDDPSALDIVHPEYYETHFLDRRSPRELIRVLPKVTARSVEARIAHLWG